MAVVPTPAGALSEECFILWNVNTTVAEKSAATLKMETAGSAEQLVPIYQTT
jgi:hypothetical protein